MKQFFRNFGRMRACAAGAAMLEFGLILPLLAAMLFGGVEITRFILFHQRIENSTNLFGDDITRLNYTVVPCKGKGGLEWVRDNVLLKAEADFNTKGRVIVSAVEASYAGAPNDKIPTTQLIKWQWDGGGASKSGYASKLGSKGSKPNGGSWPSVFSKSPDDGGMFDGDRIVVVEVFYAYEALFPFYNVFLGGSLDSEVTDVYKTAFFRSRAGSMNQLAGGC